MRLLANLPSPRDTGFEEEHREDTHICGNPFEYGLSPLPRKWLPIGATPWSGEDFQCLRAPKYAASGRGSNSVRRR